MLSYSQPMLFHQLIIAVKKILTVKKNEFSHSSHVLIIESTIFGTKHKEVLSINTLFCISVFLFRFYSWILFQELFLKKILFKKISPLSYMHIHPWLLLDLCNIMKWLRITVSEWSRSPINE